MCCLELGAVLFFHLWYGKLDHMTTSVSDFTVWLHFDADRLELSSCTLRLYDPHIKEFYIEYWCFKPVL